MRSKLSRATKLFIFSILILQSIFSFAELSVDDFFSQPAVTNLSLRPDAKFVLELVNSKNQQEIHLVSLDKSTDKIIFKAAEYGSNDSVISSLLWLNNRYIAVRFFDKRAGVADLLDTKFLQKLLIIDTNLEPGNPEQILSVRTSGWLLGPDPDHPDQFLYAKNGMQSYIYRISENGLRPDKAPVNKMDKIDGGQFVEDNQLIKIDGFVIRWYIKNTKIKSALILKKAKNLSLIEFDDAKSQTDLMTWDLNEKNNDKKKDKTSQKSISDFIPIAVAKADNEYYCLDISEDASRKLYLVNYKNKDFKIIFETEAFKIVDLIFSPDHQLTGVQVLKDDKLEIESLANNTEEKKASSETSLNLVLSQTSDLKYKISYRESHNQPGQFWLETANAPPKLIAEKFPSLNKKLKSLQIESKEEINGLKIPYLLNLPNTNKKSPLLVMPHGGPIGIYDSPYYDTMTQFLVSNGYAVLRVNYRGSGGQSESFRDSGKHQWGKQIPEDINKIVSLVIRRDDIDANRVGLFGMSYGGYAALFLLMNYPETYKCGVAIAGVYDLNIHLQSANYSETIRNWYKDYVGDINSNYDELKLISPVYFPEKLTKPILLMHGDQDKRVDIEQSYRMKLSLEKASKPVSFIVLKNAGHEIKNTEEAKQILNPTLEFLKINL